MGNSGWHIRGLVLRFLGSLLKLYPPRFRREFSSEMQEVILSRVRNAGELGWMAWLSVVFQEIMGLVPSIIQEGWHEIRLQKEGAMVVSPHPLQDGFMKTVTYIQWADPPLWLATLANLLPLWLITFALTADISLAFGIFVLALTLPAIILLLWLGWITPDLILYSLLPFATLFTFEEIPALYKAPFRLLCALFLTAGIIVYRISLHKDSIGFAWLSLVVFFVGTYLLASNANQNYWQMTGNATPWLVFFFSP